MHVIHIWYISLSSVVEAHPTFRPACNTYSWRQICRINPLLVGLPICWAPARWPVVAGVEEFVKKCINLDMSELPHKKCTLVQCFERGMAHSSDLMFMLGFLTVLRIAVYLCLKHTTYIPYIRDPSARVTPLRGSGKTKPLSWERVQARSRNAIIAQRARRPDRGGDAKTKRMCELPLGIYSAKFQIGRNKWRFGGWHIQPVGDRGAVYCICYVGQ